MKDIRPLLKKLIEILESSKEPEKIIRSVQEVKEEFELLYGTVYDELDRIGYVGSDGKVYGCAGESFDGWEFENDRRILTEVLKSHRNEEWPDSHDKLSVSYINKENGFGLSIEAQISGCRVVCIYDDLKQEVEKALSKLNQNQSSQNFLLNAVYVLPPTYKEYKLIL